TIYRIGTDGLISTVAGTGASGGPAADYIPATQSAVSFGNTSPLALLPGGHLILTEHGNNSLRYVW
ncbi:MAG: hypothetical protein FJ104_12890, partial [Deltaproteobacteria bacterium]|nr:hypothetical protein [Deltaproteobacteria bacterium]